MEESWPDLSTTRLSPELRMSTSVPDSIAEEAGVMGAKALADEQLKAVHAQMAAVDAKIMKIEKEENTPVSNTVNADEPLTLSPTVT